MGKKENRKKWRKVVPAVLTAVVILAVIVAFFLGRTQGGGETESSPGGMVVDTRAAQDGGGESAENPLAGRSVYFSGIEDAAIGRETVVQLDNREENLDFLLRYEIYDAGTGDLVFETDLIPSGQHIDWVPGETLEPGEYTLDFLQIPYYPDPSGEYISLTQGSNQVTLAILD